MPILRLMVAGRTPMGNIGAMMRSLLHIAFGALKLKKPFDVAFDDALNTQRG